MNDTSFVARVRDLAGFEGNDEAKRAIRAVLLSLGERLRDDERGALAAALPESLRDPLQRATYAGDFDRDELYARVARHERVDRGFGAEHAQVVCRALGEALATEALLRLQKELGPAIGDLFEQPEPITVVERAAASSRSRIVASARPGSSHPLSEANPDRAQSESVVRAENPHAGSKLSSAHGLTQESVGDSLATKHEGSGRSIAEKRS